MLWNLAILRDQGLEKYVLKDVAPPSLSQSPTSQETSAAEEWKNGEVKARTRIELSIGDAEIIHLTGTNTAKQMWDQLVMVKEPKGCLGILATRRALYQTTAEEGVDMIAHILKLRGLQNKLHSMDNLIADEDFVMIIITSLPESWDHFMGSFLGARGSMSTITSQELILLLLDED